MKSLPFIVLSNPIWYLERCDWKGSSKTSSALSLIMIFILSLFECITLCSSVSLWGTKLTGIVNWIFHVLGFLRSFMISFKYGLILSKYISIDSVLFLAESKITYSCWFIITFLLHAQKVSNISHYSVFDCFILFFQSKKISDTFNCSIIHFFS